MSNPCTLSPSYLSQDTVCLSFISPNCVNGLHIHNTIDTVHVYVH